MKVTRDIDIKNLKEVFKRQIDLAVKDGEGNVKLNFVTALRILDVLEETQTNEMELHNKTDANGNLLRSTDSYGKALNHFQKANGIVPDCYGCYVESGKCTNCKDKIECLIDKHKKLERIEEIEPSCFGNYDDTDLECNNCEGKEFCVEETIYKKRYRRGR